MNAPAMRHFLVPLLRSTSPRGLRIRRTGLMLAHEVDTAFDSGGRRRGLLGRDAVGQGRALVLAPCSSIHTAFMRFPIDVVFVRRDGRVLKVSPSVAPWRVRLSPRAFAVIELDGGTAGSMGLEPGDVIEVVASDGMVRDAAMRVTAPAET